MAFRLVHAKYDRDTGRAYVELRDVDDDGGDAIATARDSPGSFCECRCSVRRA